MIDYDVLKSFAGSRVLVTGGTGLIGRQIVDLLVQGGAAVKTVSLDKIGVNDKAEHCVADLSNFSLCMDITHRVDYVFHVAGVKGSIQVTKEKPASFFVPLLQMNTNILEAARLNNVKKLVYTSSIGAYASAEIFKEGENEEGPPMDEFPGLAKRVAEQQIKAYRIQYGLKDFSIVRPANVYGPGDNFDPENAMVVPSLMAKILRGDKPITIWGDGSAIRDFAFSRDVAEGVILALVKGTDSGYVNLGTGVGYSIRELVETLAQITEFSFVFDTSKSGGFPRRVMDITKAKTMIGYNPTTSLYDGCRETWEWFVQHPTHYHSRKNYFVDEEKYANQKN